MKFVDKIDILENIDELIFAIVNDQNSNDILVRRFPVRLIFLQKFETFRSLVMRLSELGIKKYDLENDLPHNDGWITKDALIDRVIRLENSTVITPFSEIIRFYSKPDFKNFFNQLLLVENSNLKRRIYLPLIGIQERFEKNFFQDFSRKEETPRYWGLTKEAPNSIKVYLSNLEPIKKFTDYETIANTEEWLKFWKQKSPSNVICYSRPLNLFGENTLPDTIFKIEKFKNTKCLIEKIYNKVIPIEYIESENDHWVKLCKLLDDGDIPFQNFVKNYFNVKSLSIKTIIPIWLKTSSTFEKWLLKHYVLSQDCLKEKYIYKVLEQLQEYSNNALLKCLYLKIFEIDIIPEDIDERLFLIKQYEANEKVVLTDETQLEIEFKMRQMVDPNQALLISSGIFVFEKKFILELLINGKIVELEVLSNRFPDLHSYLSEIEFNNIKTEQYWIYEYINEYKKSKLLDKPTEKLSIIIGRYNESESSFFNWYHSFESIHKILHKNKVDKLFWIDALGIEWTGFIENYLRTIKSELRVSKTLIGTANLPTSTEQNKIYDSKYIQDFDLFIHKKSYSYPETIFGEINEIKRILDTQIALDSDQTIAIVADHGLSALSRLVDSKKYGKNDSHEGRYIELKNKEHIKDSDYIYYQSEVNNKHYLITLKHNSLGIKPIREVHGGCTPEEVLVPFILISNKIDDSGMEYHISIDSEKILKKDPQISFHINPKPLSADYEINGIVKKLKFAFERDRWEATLDKTLSGKVYVNIIVGKNLKTFEINIISGFIEEDLF